jgi:CubicO group peptidase (beta-lactamase class C family)
VGLTARGKPSRQLGNGGLPRPRAYDDYCAVIRLVGNPRRGGLSTSATVGRGDRGEAATSRDLDRPRELFVMLRQVRAVAAALSQSLAWEISDREPTIIEKYGGLNNASAYIGMMPSRKLGIVILGNRGNQYPNEPGRRILLELAAALLQPTTSSQPASSVMSLPRFN